MAEVGTTLVFENERVRVWEFTLQPGEEKVVAARLKAMLEKASS